MAKFSTDSDIKAKFSTDSDIRAKFSTDSDIKAKISIDSVTSQDKLGYVKKKHRGKK